MKTRLKLIAAMMMAALPATAQEVPGVTDDSITIGVMGPFSGNASSYSKALVGMMAYYDKVNAEGGVHGRKLVAIPEDTACDPSKGLAAAKKLADVGADARAAAATAGGSAVVKMKPGAKLRTASQIAAEAVM